MRKTLIAVGVAFACASFLPVASAQSVTVDKTNEHSNTTIYTNPDFTGTADDTFTANGTWSSLISVNNGSHTVSGFKDFTANVDNKYDSGSVNTLFASNGATLKLTNIGTLNLTAKGKGVTNGNSPIPIHAYGGKIEADVTGDIKIATSVGNPLFFQATTDGKEAWIKLKSAGDVVITSSAGCVASGIMQKGTLSSKILIDAQNIAITNTGADAVQVYDSDKYWNPDSPRAGETSVQFTAAKDLTLTAKRWGIYQTRNFKDTSSDSSSSIKAGGAVTISGDAGAIRVKPQTDLVTNHLTIDAPVVTLTSKGDGVTASDNSTIYSGTVDLGKHTQIDFTSSTGRSQVTILAEKGNAVTGKDVTSLLNFTNSDVSIAKGDVESAGSINLKESNVTPSETSKFYASKVEAANASIVFNQVAADVVKVDTVTDNSSIKVVAGSNITAQYGSAEAVLQALEEAGAVSGKAKDTLTANLAGQESDLTSAWERDTNGKVTYANGSAESPVLTAAKHANAANLAQWRYEVNHLSDRLGDVRNLRGTAGTWARVYGAEAKVSDSVSTRVRADTLQVGSDVALGENWIVGAAFGYTDSDSDFTVGSLDTDAYTFALYGTGYFPCGGYVDIIGRMGRMSSDVTMDRNFTASYDNTAFGLSAEVGYEWNIAQGFYVTPQAELAYSYVKGDDYTAGNGVTAKQANFESLVGRLGVQAGVKFNENRGNIYATVSVNHDFNGETEATASQGANASQRLAEDLGGTWVSYGIGAQFNVLDNLAFYGSLTRANGSDYQENFRYSVGVRYVW